MLMGRRTLSPAPTICAISNQEKKAALVCDVGLKPPGLRGCWPCGQPSASSTQGRSRKSCHLAGRSIHQQAHLLWLGKGLGKQGVTPRPAEQWEPPEPAFMRTSHQLPPLAPAQLRPPNSGAPAKEPGVSKRPADLLPGSLGHDGLFARLF